MGQEGTRRNQSGTTNATSCSSPSVHFSWCLFPDSHVSLYHSIGKPHITAVPFLLLRLCMSGEGSM